MNRLFTLGLNIYFTGYSGSYNTQVGIDLVILHWYSRPRKNYRVVKSTKRNGFANYSNCSIEGFSFR